MRMRFILGLIFLCGQSSQALAQEVAPRAISQLGDVLKEMRNSSDKTIDVVAGSLQVKVAQEMVNLAHMNYKVRTVCYVTACHSAIYVDLARYGVKVYMTNVPIHSGLVMTGSTVIVGGLVDGSNMPTMMITSPSARQGYAKILEPVFKNEIH